jgi:CheY-like chemotaxis protein/two-component sensor histidine kinase
MARIVEDLIDLARIVEKKVGIRRERVAVHTFVESALETSRPQLDEHKVQLSIQLPDEPLYLDADPARMSQVLVNLLNNAAKHTAAGGTVSLIVERLRDHADTSGHAVIRVRDTGSGIPASLLPHIFEMFTQGPRSTHQGRGGLGVGLALVRDLVEMHGGSVEAYSAGPGEGSEFVVKLPLAEGPRESTPPGAHPAHGGITPMRIVVADDNDDQVESLGMLLTMMGHTVHRATNGPQAIEMAMRFRPDLMLIDIGMPGMEGYEVARRVREQPDLRNVVLIAQTGWGGDVDRERSREAGFDEHLVKPVTMGDLEEVLRSVRP